MGGQDYVDVWNSGPDGHYTYRYAHAFTVSAQKGDSYISGYSETPNAVVTVSLQRGGSPVASYGGNSDSGGYFSANLSSGTPVEIKQGDTLKVQTDDGDSVSLLVPGLTVNTDTTNNSLYGKSPALQPVNSIVWRRYNNQSWSSHSQNTTADGAGNYSAPFNNLILVTRLLCRRSGSSLHTSRSLLLHPRRTYLLHVRTVAPAVGSDAYENDDTSASATAYTGIQVAHIPRCRRWRLGVLRCLLLRTSPRGSFTGSKLSAWARGWTRYLHLYASDGVTELASDDDSGPAGRLSSSGSLSTPGVYYVKVRPYNDSVTAYCDAVYDLRIFPERAWVFLPLVLR